MFSFVTARLSRKFVLVGLLGLTAVIVPVLPLLGIYAEQLDFVGKERDGVAVHRELRTVLQELQRHRGASTGVLEGKADFRARMEAAQAAVDAAATRVDAAFAAHGRGLDGGGPWVEWKRAWNHLKEGLATAKPQENFAAHGELIGRLIDVMGMVGDSSNLTLDPELATYYAMDLALVQVPGLTEQIDRGRAHGSLALSERSLPRERRDALIAIAVETGLRNQSIQTDAGKLFSADPAAKAALNRPFIDAGKAVDQFLANLDGRMLKADNLVYEPGKFADEATGAIDASFTLYDQVIETLDTLLAMRQSGVESRRLGVLIAILLATLLAAGVTALILRRVRASVAVAAESLAEIAAGRLDRPAVAPGSDEIGQLIGRIDDMRVQLGERLAKEREVAARTARIKIALDGASMPLTISDDRDALIYMNAAAKGLWGAMAATLAAGRAGFTLAGMYGRSVVDLFDSEESRAAYRAEVTAPRTLDLGMGGKTLRVTVTPVRDAEGGYLGRASQWVDRSAEIALEQEVQAIIAAAAQGDFAKRLRTDDKQGFFAALAGGLNRLLDTAANGLQDIARVLQALAKGDLTQTIDADYQGLFGQLQLDTNTTIARLQEVVRRIQESTEAITIAAKEIAAGNLDLSSRTEQQASNLEETASSMEELNATVKQNADSSKKANDLARDSNEIATRGGELVKAVVATMGTIQGSSKKIADIIGVIDSIAFQTNILALNAAVEAARAGEQGRGFAVVATEVRNLAQRSATAAKEIKALIADSVDKVDGGVAQVGRAGDTMNEVVASFRLVAQLVTEISNASREQSSGIEQITRTVSQMDQATQQNAALVEEAAAAAASLENQARGWVQTVGVFHLPGEGGRKLPGPVLRDATLKRLAKPRPLAGASLALARRGQGDDAWEGF